MYYIRLYHFKKLIWAIIENAKLGIWVWAIIKRYNLIRLERLSRSLAMISGWDLSPAERAKLSKSPIIIKSDFQNHLSGIKNLKHKILRNWIKKHFAFHCSIFSWLLSKKFQKFSTGIFHEFLFQKGCKNESEDNYE